MRSTQEELKPSAGRMNDSNRRSAFRALVQDFSPFWFTWCMNSGVLGILLHQLPYQFHGVKIIATIFYVLALVLFIFFSIIFILRFVLYGATAYQEVTGEPPELMFCACWPIAFMTLTSLTALIPSNAYWGHSFTMVSYVMWWFVCLWNTIFLFGTFIILIRDHEASDRRLPMLVILPAVSVSTVAVTGGIVASLSHNISPTLAVPVIIVSFMLVGIGILMGLMLSTYLFHAMLAKGWPPTAQIASLFIFVGPMGQSSAALQALGSAANKYKMFAEYNRGTFITAELAAPLEAACVLIGLMLTGLGIIWLILSTYAMVEKAYGKELEWTPGWNSIIFPTGTLATSFQFLALETDGAAFKVVTCILVVVLVIVFLGNLVMSIPRIAAGKLLVVRDDPRVKSEEKEK